jgi:hypothetical protein
MRALFLVVVSFAWALVGWFMFTQPTLAGSDTASAPHFSAVAEAKREEAALAQCDARASKKQIKADDRQAFIEKCLLAVDTAEGR